MTNSAARSAERVNEFVAAWNQEQQRFDTVRFAYKGTVHTPKGYAQDGWDPTVKKIIVFPAENWTYELTAEVLLDVARGRFRIVRTGEQTTLLDDDSPLYYPLNEWYVFDGDVSKRFQPHDRNVGAANGNIRMSSEFRIEERPLEVIMLIEHYPLLFAVGYRCGEHPPFPEFYRAEIPQALFKTTGTFVHNDVECSILQTTPTSSGLYYEYWVANDDPLQIRRFVVHSHNGEQREMTSIDVDITYRDSEWGALPDHWQVSKYSFTTDRVKTWNLRLTDFEANPVVSDDDFALQPPPGTRVVDQTRPRGDQEYVAAAVGELELPPEEVVMQQAQARSRFWLYAGLALLAAVVLAVAWKQRKVA